MPAPTPEEAVAYLASVGATQWSPEDVASAYAAEKGAQARRCRVPADGAAWDPDLAEALLRRVAVNLALRALPLALQASMSEGGVSTSRVGGGDPEVRRLERPFRKLILGRASDE